VLTVGRWVLRVIGALALLLGVIWMLQGVGVLLGSIMTGQMFWFWMGLLVAAIGTGGMILASRLVRR
jgi:hypothetical protein